MVEDSLATLKRFWPKGDDLATNASGASRGLLCWWDAEKFVMHSAIENKNRLFIKLEKKEKFWIGNIYGPTIHAQKDIFWTSLEEQCEGKRLLPCFIAGDFNVTISVNERRGGTKVRDPFGERLQDLIS